MRKYRLKIGLDVDDVLYECNSYAIKLLKEKYGNDPALDVNRIRSWGAQGDVSDERLRYFSSPDFVRVQPMYGGAKKFVRELCKIADVFFVTSVPPACMSARAERLVADFPEVPQSNIIIGTRKDVVNLDILLDDSAHNISSSQASYPVLMRRPWNTDLSGLLSVNSYSDFIHLASIIRNSFVEESPDISKGGVLCLVGPTGTGKTKIASALTQNSRFVKPITTTTRPKMSGEADNAYRFISAEQFIREKENGEFIETTVYSKQFFGTSKSQISPIVESGKIAVIPIDICGALTMKNIYRSRAVLAFTDGEKKDILTNILNRPSSDEDKINRIMSLDFEARNVELCDFSIRYDDGIDVCLDVIYRSLGLQK